MGIIAVTVAIMCLAPYHQQQVFGQAAFAGDNGARPPGVLQSPSCTPPEYAVVTHILTDQHAAKKLYPAADQDKREAQENYPLDALQAMIARGDDDHARAAFDQRMQLLDRAESEIEQARQIDTAMRADFASLSLGCRRAIVAAAP